MKKIIATALVTTLAVGTAFAQSSTSSSGATNAASSTPSTAATGSVTNSTITTISHPSADEMTSSKIVGTSVYNTNNEKIGEVNDLILDNNGKVAGVVIGVGGFLGMGERNVAVSFNSVKFSKDNKGYERITVAATKDQLKSMTPYESNKTNG